MASPRACGKTWKEITMGKEHQGRGMPLPWVRMVIIIAVLLVTSMGSGHARGEAPMGSEGTITAAQRTPGEGMGWLHVHGVTPL
jgi:hypothetical protein